MNKTKIVIYHAQCLDGFGSAFAVWLKLGDLDTEYHAAKHGETPPDVDNREVIIVDFSYKRQQLIEICQRASSVVIIDHHISALNDLKGLDDLHNNLTLIFDMAHSGAVLTWHYFHNSVPPQLLLDIEDRDLWNFNRPDSEAVNAAIDSYPFEFEQWKRWIDSDLRDELIKEGEAIVRYRRQLIETYKKRAVIGSVAGHKVPVVNCPYSIISEVLGELSVDYSFAAGYQDGETKRSWSLRSNGDRGADVSEIAQRFGGGGHRNAAGFSTPIEDDHYEIIPQ